MNEHSFDSVFLCLFGSAMSFYKRFSFVLLCFVAFRHALVLNCLSGFSVGIVFLRFLLGDNLSLHTGLSRLFLPVGYRFPLCLFVLVLCSFQRAVFSLSGFIFFWIKQWWR